MTGAFHEDGESLDDIEAQTRARGNTQTPNGGGRIARFACRPPVGKNSRVLIAQRRRKRRPVTLAEHA